MTSILEFLPMYKDNDNLLHDISVEKLHEELLKAMENIMLILPDISSKYEKIIFLGFHPVSLPPLIKYYKELKNTKILNLFYGMMIYILF